LGRGKARWTKEGMGRWGTLRWDADEPPRTAGLSHLQREGLTRGQGASRKVRRGFPRCDDRLPTLSAMSIKPPTPPKGEKVL